MSKYETMTCNWCDGCGFVEPETTRSPVLECDQCGGTGRKLRHIRNLRKFRCTKGIYALRRTVEARQGYYVYAETEAEAEAEMKRRFPGLDLFTVHDYYQWLADA